MRGNYLPEAPLLTLFEASLWSPKVGKNDSSSFMGVSFQPLVFISRSFRVPTSAAPFQTPLSVPWISSAVTRSSFLLLQWNPFEIPSSAPLSASLRTSLQIPSPLVPVQIPISAPLSHSSVITFLLPFLHLTLVLLLLLLLTLSGVASGRLLHRKRWM